MNTHDRNEYSRFRFLFFLQHAVWAHYYYVSSHSHDGPEKDRH